MSALNAQGARFIQALGHTRPVYWYAPDKKGTGVPYETLTVDIDLAKAKGFGVFITVNELGDKPNDKGNLRDKNNVVAPRACFADFDLGTPEQQLEKISTSPIQPSAIVKSGRGYHLYWFLHDTSKEDLTRWTKIQKNIAHHFGSDEAICDPARLMRLPGSYHVKNNPVEVLLEVCDENLRYSLDEIDLEFDDAPQSKLNNAVVNALTTDAPEGSRRTRCEKIIGSLLAKYKPVDWQDKAWPLAVAFNATKHNPPLPEYELRALFDSLSKAELTKRSNEKSDVHTFNEDDLLTKVIDTEEGVDVYIRTEEGDAIFHLTYITRPKIDELNALLVVEFYVPGSVPKPVMLGRVNLFSGSSRNAHATTLRGALGKGIKWDILLSTVCLKVDHYLSNKDTTVDLSKIEVNEIPWLLHPFLQEKSANIIFADGGTSKTFITLNMAIALAAGKPFLGFTPKRPIKTLFIDYEDEAVTARYRINMLCKAPNINIDPLFAVENVKYHKPDGILAVSVSAIKKLVHMHNIELLLIDSLSSAAGSGLETPDSANAYFDALSKIGVTSLSIAHVAKSGTEQDDQSHPFGSIFWTNRARNIWNIRGKEATAKDELDAIAGIPAKHLGFFHRKCNSDRLQKPIGAKIYFAGTYVLLEKENDIFFKGDSKTCRDQIVKFLREYGPSKRTNIEDALPQFARKSISNDLADLINEKIVKSDGMMGNQGATYSLSKPTNSTIF